MNRFQFQHSRIDGGRTRCIAGGAVSLAMLAATSMAHAAVQFGQLDTFEDGTTLGWSQGAASPNPTSNVNTGGPAGAGDHFLLNTSSGGFGSGSKQVMFNRGQWIGDYNTAGVTRIDMNVANFGATSLALRVAIAGGTFGGSRYGSTTPITLPAGSGWQRVTFDLTSNGMTSLGASDTLSTVLGSVTELRLLSAADVPGFNGDTIAASLGVDNARALRKSGDANFDGSVNFTDLLTLAQNYGLATGATWQTGDFDFDGAVNFTDLLALAQNYGSSAVQAGALSESFASEWARAQALVPEPSVALAAAATTMLTPRRRRR